MNASLRGSARDALSQARAWGWPFAVGAAGLALAAVVSLGVVPRIQRASLSVAIEADSAARHASQAGPAAQDTRRIESTAEHFLAEFPAADSRQTRVATLLELAVHHSMALRGGEFQLSRDKASGLLRYSATLPLTGTYAQLRGFVEDALTSDGALSLDRLRLRRAAVGAATVEADLTWSFYMRPGDTVPPGKSP